MVEVGDDRAERGPVDIGGGHVGSSPVGRRDGVAGLDEVRAVVVILRVRDRANGGITIRSCRQPGQVFADPQAGRHGINRPKRTAISPGNVGLHVESVELAGTAVEEDKQHGLGLATGAVVSG